MRPRTLLVAVLAAYCVAVTIFVGLDLADRNKYTAAAAYRASRLSGPGGDGYPLSAGGPPVAPLLPRDAAFPYPMRIAAEQLNSFRQVDEVFHVLTHSHWDREWYLSLEAFRGSLVILMDRVFGMLSNESANFHHFHLDGQFLMLEDYLQARPSMIQQAIDLNKQGKITLGPFYSQPDFYLASHESLIRNLMYGMSLSSQYGGTSKVGYVPDSFGFVGQLPQILRGFGMHSFATTRFLHNVGSQIGFSRPRATEGFWRGSDGSTVLYVYFGNHYCHAAKIFHGSRTDTELHTVANLTKYSANMIKNLRRDIATSGSASKHKLVMYGCDHFMTDPDVGNLVVAMDNDASPPHITANTSELNQSSYRVVQTNIDDYVELLAADIADENQTLPEIRGEVREEVDHLINSASTKISLKQKNFAVQTLLEKWAEPLETYSWAIAARPYSADRLWFIWKPVLQTHAHDSICATSASPVIHDSMSRMGHSEQAAYRIISDQVTQFAPALLSRLRLSQPSNENLPIILVNPTNTWRFQWVLVSLVSQFIAHKACGIKNSLAKNAPADPIIFLSESPMAESYELPDTLFRVPKRKGTRHILVPARLPPNGIAAFEIVSLDCSRMDTKIKDVKAEGNPVLQNEFVSVEVNLFDGSCAITNKKTGHQWRKVNLVKSAMEMGSSYQHYRGHLGNPMKNTALVWCKQTPAFASCQINGQLGANSTVTLTYVLYENSRTLEIKTVIDNKQKQHFVSANFPALRGNAGRKDFKLDVDGSFEYVGRNPFIGRYAHQNRFTSMYAEGGSLTVSNRGIPEYYVTSSLESFEMTLIRGVGKIGDWIEGRLEDDVLQELQKMSFDYAVTVAGCRITDPGCTADIEARNFVDPIGALAGWTDNAFRPQRYIDLDVTGTGVIADLKPKPPASSTSGIVALKKLPTKTIQNITQLFALAPEKIILSSVKKAESRDAMILRLYNPIEKTLNVTLGSGLLGISALEFAQLNEHPMKPAEKLEQDENGTVSFPVGGKKIVTLLLTVN